MIQEPDKLLVHSVDLASQAPQRGSALRVGWLGSGTPAFGGPGLYVP